MGPGQCQVIAGGAPVNLREALHEDIEAMARVVVGAWRFAYSGFLPPTMMDEWAREERFVNRFNENWHLQHHRVVACTQEGTVIGFAVERSPCGLQGFDAEIGGLYVDPKSSRRGVGRLLVTSMVKHFCTLEHRSRAIHTLAENKIGCSFYERVGGVGHSFTDWNGVQGKWYVWPNLGDGATMLNRE